MSLKTIAAKIFAQRIYRKTLKWSNNPLKTQEAVFRLLLNNASNTKFGRSRF